MDKNRTVLPTLFAIEALSFYALYPEKHRFDVIGRNLNAYTVAKNGIVWVY